MTTEYNLKDARKTLTTVLKTTNQLKTKTFEEVKQSVIEILRQYPGQITQLRSDNNETLAHIIIKDNKFDAFSLIIESYMSILNCNINNAHLNNEFFDWFLLENSLNETVLELCAQNGNPKIINYIYDIVIKSSESKFRVLENRSGIFHHAAQNNQCYPIIFFYEKLQNFYKENLIIDIPNENGITPLHYACIKGSKQVIDLLLDLGANMNAQDSENNTSLHYAVMSHSKRIVKKLLVRGVDRTKYNKDLQTPYDKALQINDKQIAEILLLKNNCCLICSSHENVRAIKGGRNNILLLLVVLFIILMKFIYSYRMAYIYLGEFQSDLIPFIPDIMSQNNGNYGQVEKNIKEFTDLFENNKCLIGSSCMIEVALVFISTIADYVLLGIIVYFLCFAKNVFMKKKLKNKIPSLIELYEKSKFVCVKCRNVTDASTVHCIVCNACVKGFDHHCFWLNTCISNLNMFSFKMFIYSITTFFISNLVFFLTNILLVSRWSKQNYFQKIMFQCEEGEICNEVYKVVWILLNMICGAVAVYCIIVMILPMLIVICACSVRQNTNTFENKLLESESEPESNN
jgi:ankyrin repeat protein